LGADINELLLVHLNQLKVFSGDVVIVLLHLFESLLVILHEVVNMLIFTLLNLVDLHLHPELELLFQVLKLLLIVGYELFLSGIELHLQLLVSLFELLLSVLDFADVLHLVPVEILLLILLLISHLLLLLLVEPVLLSHRSLSGSRISSHIVAVELVLILYVLDLLDIYLDFCPMGFF